MSYERMDHAGWVERNANAARSMSSRRKKVRSDNRKGWAACPEKLNPFQGAVMDICGIVGGGIYNAPIAWESVTWGESYIHVPWRGEMATFDFNRLSMLVFLAHEASIRVSVSPYQFSLLLLGFWPAKRDEGLSRRHPTLDDAVALFRQYIGIDHPTIHSLASARGSE